MEKYKSTIMFFIVLLTTALIGGFLITSSLGFSPIKQHTNLGDVKFTSIEYVKTKFANLVSDTETADSNESQKIVDASKLKQVINVNNLSDNQLIQVKAIIAANQRANLLKKEKSPIPVETVKENKKIKNKEGK